MSYVCIPTETVAKLLKGIQSGAINADKFGSMTAEERINFLKDHVGGDAQNVSDLLDNTKELNKIKTTVTLDEAKKINDLAQKVKDAKQDLSTPEKRTAYGRAVMDMTEYANSLKPKAPLFSFSNIANLPKSTLTSILHFSAPFVQGWGMLSTPNFYAGLSKMFGYFASEEKYKNLQADIISHPN